MNRLMSRPPRFRPLIGRTAFAILCVLLLLPALVGSRAHAATTRALSRTSYPNPTLVRDPNGAVYLVWNNVRHWINSAAAFNEMGESASQEIALDWSAINAIPNGTAIAINTVSGGMVWPLAPVITAPSRLSFDQPSVALGQIIHLSGSGFQANEQVVITAPGVTFNANVDDQGNLSVDVPISTNNSTGLHHVYVVGASGRFAVQVFHVTAPGAPTPTISPVASSVPSGGTLSVQGSGFAAGEKVRIFLDGGALTAETTASSNGSYGPVSIQLTSHFQVGSTYALAAYGVSSYGYVHTTFSVQAGAPTATATATAPATATATATPSATSLPAPLLNLSTASVSPGGQVVVSGSGFHPQETVLLYFNGGLQGGPTSDTNGGFSGAVVTVPANYQPGTYTILARGASSGITVTATVTVQTAQPVPTAAIAPSTSQVTAGSALGVSGTGFLGGEQVRISFNNRYVVTAAANAAGTFVNTYFTVPAGTAPGRYGISASGVNSGRVAGAAVSVLARPAGATVYVSPSSVRPGQTVTIAGNGWSPRETVIVKVDGAVVLAPTSDSRGVFAARYIVRLSIARHTVTAQGAASGRFAQATLNVVRPITARISVSPSRVRRGKAVRVEGSNFLANEVVLVRFRGSLVAAPQARRDGRVGRVTFTIPNNSPLGYQQITLTGARSGRVARANVYVMAKAKHVRAGLSVSASTTHRGGRVYVSGSGFQAHEEVLVRYRNTVVVAVVAGPSGTFGHIGYTVAFNTPYGKASLVAKGMSSGRSASVSLRVATSEAKAWLVVAPKQAKPRHMVSISGGDFSRAEYVLIRLDNAKVALVKANSHGSFGVRFVLPTWARPGKDTLRATGTHSGHTASVSLKVTHG